MDIYALSKIQFVLAVINCLDRSIDRVRMILSLTHGNIQMMAECFIDFLDSNAKRIIRTSMGGIASTLGVVPTFAPNIRTNARKSSLSKAIF